jgi:hypothetical protein
LEIRRRSFTQVAGSGYTLQQIKKIKATGDFTPSLLKNSVINVQAGNLVQGQHVHQKSTIS